MRPPALIALLVTAPLALAVAGCGDDGAAVRSGGGASASASGASGTGLSPSDAGETTSADPLVEAAVTEYERYVRAQVAQLRSRTSAFTGAVRAGDLAAARAAYAPSREPWERIEPVAGLVGATDAVADSRVDDFAGPSDPDFTGWHRLELLLWEKGTTRGGAPFATRLDGDLATLEAGVTTLEIPPAAMAKGAAELIEEVSEGKITGEEDRYSKTGLWDVGANVEGSRRVVDLLAPALQQADADLLARLRAGFDDLEAGLRPLRRGDGWVRYCLPDDPYPAPALCPRPTVTQAQVDAMKARLAALSEDLARVPGALGLS